LIPAYRRGFLGRPQVEAKAKLDFEVRNPRECWAV
jgi:hypothetical protein